MISLSKLFCSLKDLCFRPMDIAGLAVVRMLYGLLIIYESWRYSDIGLINFQFSGHIFYFKYRYFEWIKPLSAAGIQWVFIIYALAGLAICLGIFYRAAALTAALCISYIFLIDSTNYLNHFYLIIIFACMMLFVPADRGWSLYALFNQKKSSSTVPGWGVWLIRAQLIIVYSYAAIAKMNVDWMNGMPLYDWIGDAATEQGFESILDKTAVIYFFAYGGLLYDLLVIPGLLCRHTRALAYCFSICFHLMNSYLFDIGIFPWFMLATTTIFFDTAWPREFLNFFFKDRFMPISLAYSPAGQSSGLQRFAIGIMLAHLSFQALFPLRHFVYPGYVGWSEEGHNFSWHMKLRDKYGDISFTVRDPDTGRTQVIDPKRYLLRRQINKMTNRPFLVLQFAHFLRDAHTRPGEKPAQVYVESSITLNGRRAQRMIDPTVDLGAVEMKEFGNSWIFPLRQPVWNAASHKNRFGPAFKKDDMAQRAILGLSN